MIELLEVMVESLIVIWPEEENVRVPVTIVMPWGPAGPCEQMSFGGSSPISIASAPTRPRAA